MSIQIYRAERRRLRKALLEGLDSLRIGQFVRVRPRDDEWRPFLRCGLDAGITQTCTQRDTGNSRRAGSDVRADLVALVRRHERRQARAERRAQNAASTCTRRGGVGRRLRDK